MGFAIVAVDDVDAVVVCDLQQDRERNKTRSDLSLQHLSFFVENFYYG